MRAEIIAVGSELLTPYRQDTNSLYLTGKLNSLGITVSFKTIVGDHRNRLAEVVRLALARSELIILSGGLGPTEDDLNREVVAEVLGRRLLLVEDIRKRMRERWARLGRAMPENNLRQAMVPEGAEWLENQRGTAPGLWIEHDGSILVLLPGPPWELEPMFETSCMPRLKPRSGGRSLRSRVYKIVGLPESEVDRRIAPAYKLYENPQTTILSVLGTIEVHLQAQGSNEAEAEAALSDLGDKIELALGDHIFSSGGESLEEVVGMYLVMKRKTVALAESCTGGLVAERLTRIAGSSAFFLGGVVCYSNELKTRLVGVPPELIAALGAVSKAVAQALAEGIRRRTGATIGLAITGIAGPGGGTPEKPVGLVFIALADERSTEVRQFQFPGDRERIRTWSAVAGLEMIRRRVRE
ncbi:MAG TPA: competence/damage-inducible protein A [Terriglobia bacterium]|nr:competence/damage-inducible protein A [Terriglobia bacterium]